MRQSEILFFDTHRKCLGVGFVFAFMPYFVSQFPDFSSVRAVIVFSGIYLFALVVLYELYLSHWFPIETGIELDKPVTTHWPWGVLVYPYYSPAGFFEGKIPKSGIPLVVVSKLFVVWTAFFLMDLGG